jgi:hypothetical protein
MGILFIIGGIAAIIAGILGKEFHAADVMSLGEYKQKTSKWSGRLVFILAGLILIAVGVKMLVGSD